jgi:SAM-dependent methyltransferase
MYKRMSSTEDYVLGTNDEEVERLGLQHHAWRLQALEAWRSAGIDPGQTVLDVGCGPGYASLDLAELVGPSGKIMAVDKSERFLSVLEERCRELHVDNITTHRADLDAGQFPHIVADRAWCRWVLSFVKDPRAVLARIADALTPESVLVVHEYFDYSTWRAAPPLSELEEFVSAVMSSWRAKGGEPDIALSLPPWLEELGFEIQIARPIVDVVRPGDLKWKWLATFIEVGRRRLVDLGNLSSHRSESIWQAFLALQVADGGRMITPGVMEIAATRNGRKPAGL